MSSIWCTPLYSGLRAWLSLTLAAVLAAGALGIAHAQDAGLSDIRVTLVADRSELTVGDPIALTLEVTHPHDHVVVMPRLAPEWGVFEVRRQTSASIAENGDGTRTTGQQLELTLFAPGEFETPDLPLSIRLPDGSVERLFPTPVRLTVVSVLSGDDETLRDIRAPADFSTPLWELLYFRVLLANVVAAVILATLGLTFYRRARRSHDTPVPSVQYRAPREVAFEELDRIESLNLLRDGRLKDHYALVSRALRVYIQSEHLGDMSTVDAVDMTTDEIGAALGSSTLSYENTVEVVDLLTEADMVKFANEVPSASQALEAVARARRFVEDTKTDLETAAYQDKRTADSEASA